MMQQNMISRSKQQGMSTILMSVVMVFTVSMMSIYAAQVSVMEQKVSANHYRAKQAFESAQAGLDIAVAEIDEGVINNLAGNGPWSHGDLTALVNEFSNMQDKQDLEHSTDAEEVGAYRLSLEELDGDDVLKLTAEGYAGDNDPSSPINSSHSAEIILQKINLVGYLPPASIVARGSVNVDDNDMSIDNDRGDPKAAIWSSSLVDDDGDATKGSADIDVTRDGETDPNNGLYIDDRLGDLSGDNFFKNFFSLSKAQMKSRATHVVDCSNGCTHSDLYADGQKMTGVIWVDAYNDNGTPDDDSDDYYNTLNINDNFELGSRSDPVEPVVLIVDGKFRMRDSDARVNGLVYTTQDIDWTNYERGEIDGALVTEGNMNASRVSDITIDYRPNMFSTLQQAQFIYVQVPGTWKDW